jgi:uncharacterized membrane protein required for colicin V production
MITEALLLTAAEDGLPLAWIDMLGLGLVALFLLLGLVRGLWWQVIRLLGVAAAVGLARALSPRFTPTVSESFPELSDSITYGLVWFALFVSGLVVASLLGLLGKRALEAMQLGIVDRVGGGVAGIATGVLFHSAVLVVICGLGTDSWTSETMDGTKSAVLLETLTRRAPLIMDVQAAEKVAPWAFTADSESGG